MNIENISKVDSSIEDALIKAECALADIAEGEHDLESADALEWAEHRATEVLKVIRPIMKQYKIRTSD
jgi:hypothetical protein